MNKAQQLANQDYYDALERFYRGDLLKESAKADVRDALTRMRKLARDPHAGKGKGNGQQRLHLTQS